jgi:hypothetical protein
MHRTDLCINFSHSIAGVVNEWNMATKTFMKSTSTPRVIGQPTSELVSQMVWPDSKVNVL